MIYAGVFRDVPLSQGDIIDDCPIVVVRSLDLGSPDNVTTQVRGIVLTQACDLIQSKSDRVVVAVVHAVDKIVQSGVLKSVTIRDHVRAHCVYGWYFLPAGEAIAESPVDLRDLHTVPRSLLEALIAQGKRVCRLATPYREHMAQHFSTTYSRIALPEPYGTQP